VVADHPHADALDARHRQRLDVAVEHAYLGLA